MLGHCRTSASQCRPCSAKARPLWHPRASSSPCRIATSPGNTCPENKDLAQVSVFTHAPHLLHHRIVTQIMADAVPHSLPPGERHKFAPSSTPRCGQRLFRRSRACRPRARIWPWESAARWACRCGRHRSSDRAVHQSSQRQSLGWKNPHPSVAPLCASAYDSGSFYKFQPAHRFQMHAAHEAGAYNGVLIIFIVLPPSSFSRQSQR